MQPLPLVRAGGQQRQLQRQHIGRRGRFDQAQRKVRPHAGAQHLGRPQRRRALERQHLLEPEGGGAAQDGADVAGVLQAVQQHRGPPRLGRHGAGQGPQKAHWGTGAQAAQTGQQGVGQSHAAHAGG